MENKAKRENQFIDEMVGIPKGITELLTSETKLKGAEEKIRQQNEFFNNVLESLAHPFYVIDANDYTIKLANRAAHAGNLSKKTTCYALIHKRSKPCEGEEYLCPLEEVKKTKEPAAAEHIHYIDNTPRIFEVHGYPIFDSDGDIIQMIEYSLDITERKRMEEALRASLEEKEMLLKEIHHRVKNNLQIISSLLRLQSRHIKDKKVLNMLQQGQNRVKSMAFIHEKLYQSRDLTKIEFGDYTRKLASGLFHTCGVHSDTITLNIEVENVYLDINTAIPCGLIINELVSNSLKHAFPKGKVPGERGYAKGKISVRFSSNNNKLTLIVEDNGIGFPKDLDFRNTDSLGLQIVNTFIEQLEGSIKLRRKDGTSFKIEFIS